MDDLAKSTCNGDIATRKEGAVGVAIEQPPDGGGKTHSETVQVTQALKPRMQVVALDCVTRLMGNSSSLSISETRVDREYIKTLPCVIKLGGRPILSSRP